MKKVFLSIMMIIFLSNTSSCKKNEAKITSTGNDTIQSKTQEKATIKPQSKSDELVLQLKTNEAEFLKKIQGKKPEEVSRIFEAFRTKHEEIRSELNITEETLLNDYNGFYDEKTADYEVPDNLKAKFDGFKSANLKIQGIGEGYNEIQLNADYYSKLIQNKATNDYNDFLKLEAKDNSALYSGDAGLGISFEEVSERVLYWENFVNKYPKSKLLPKALKLYQMYLTDYLFGMDNTPSIDGETNLILEENKIEYERFLKKNPSANSSKIVKSFIESSGNQVEQQKIRDLINSKS